MLKGLFLGAMVGAVGALAAAIWFAHSYLGDMSAAVTRMESNAADAEHTRRSLDEAVRLLESIGPPKTGESQPPGPANPAQVLRPPFEVWDGDTFDSEGKRYRLLGVDAPGVRGRDFSCLAEFYLGRRARDMLRQEFARPNVRIEVVTFGQPAATDDWRRTLVQLRINGEDFAARLLRNDLALEGNRRAGWCNGR